MYLQWISVALNAFFSNLLYMKSFVSPNMSVKDSMDSGKILQVLNSYYYFYKGS